MNATDHRAEAEKFLQRRRETISEAHLARDSAERQAVLNAADRDMLTANTHAMMALQITLEDFPGEIEFQREQVMHTLTDASTLMQRAGDNMNSAGHTIDRAASTIAGAANQMGR